VAGLSGREILQFSFLHGFIAVNAAKLVSGKRWGLFIGR
jgi:hypothetical protein